MHFRNLLKVAGVGFLLGLAPVAESRDLTLLSYNTWLLDYIASDIRQRRRHIPEAVTRLKPDIISLQEVWGARHKHHLIREFRRRGYPYALYSSEGGLHALEGDDPFPDVESPVTIASLVPVPAFLSLHAVTGLFGWAEGDVPDSVFDIGRWTNGLLILSRYPILKSDVARMNFSLDTQVEERLVEKGAILAPIQIPGGQSLLVVNTHLGHQDYDRESGGYEPAHFENNLVQLQELASWTEVQASRWRGKRGGNFNVVINGDLNFNYRQILGKRWSLVPHAAYENLVSQNRTFAVRDVFRRPAGDPPEDTFTCGPVNSYSRAQGDSTRPSEVLDYIFVGHKAGWEVLDAKVVLTTPPGPDLMAISDHFGVFARFRIRRERLL